MLGTDLGRREGKTGSSWEWCEWCCGLCGFVTVYLCVSKCICVSACVCVTVCICVFTCVYVSLCQCVCVSVCLQVSLCLCMSLCVYRCVCVLDQQEGWQRWGSHMEPKASLHTMHCSIHLAWLGWPPSVTLILSRIWDEDQRLLQMLRSCTSKHNPWLSKDLN